MMPVPNTTWPVLAHELGYSILIAVWALMPMFFMKEPITLGKRLFLGVWYLGASLAVAVYLVTR